MLSWRPKALWVTVTPTYSCCLDKRRMCKFCASLWFAFVTLLTLDHRTWGYLLHPPHPTPLFLHKDPRLVRSLRKGCREGICSWHVMWGLTQALQHGLDLGNMARAQTHKTLSSHLLVQSSSKQYRKWKTTITKAWREISAMYIWNTNTLRIVKGSDHKLLCNNNVIFYVIFFLAYSISILLWTVMCNQ